MFCNNLKIVKVVEKIPTNYALKKLTLNIIYQEVPTKITVRSSGSKPVPQSAVSSVTTAVRVLRYFILRTLSHSRVLWKPFCYGLYS